MTSRKADWPRSTVEARIRRGVVVLLVVLLGAGWGAAQPELPAIRLSGVVVAAGDSLEVAASGLEPGGGYTLTLSGPGEPQVAEGVADDAGRLEQTFAPAEPGDWELTVAGPRLEEPPTFRIRVTPPEAVGAQGPPPPQDAPTPADSDADAEPLTDEPIANESPADEPITDEPITDEPLTDEPADEAPADEAPAGEAPAGEAPAGEAPADVPSPADVPTPDAPAETPADDPAADDRPVAPEPSEDDALADEAPAPEPPGDAEDAPGLLPGLALPEDAAPDVPADATPREPTPLESTPLEPTPGDADPDDDTLPAEGEDEDGEAAPVFPSGTPPTGIQPDEVVLEQGTVAAYVGGREWWRLGFPAGSGETTAVLELADAVYAAHGNSVLELEPETGQVRSRATLPAQVTALRAEGSDVVALSGGEAYTLRGGEVREPVRFGADPAPFGWLRAEAQVADPVARLGQDPTNPWLHLEAGRVQEGAARAQHYRDAVAAAETFYDLAGVAQELVRLGALEEAGAAMTRALQDFAARGYDPRLLRDPELHARYNLPLRPFEAAVARGDRAAADFWAPWLAYFAVSEAEGPRAALLRYAEQLQAAGEAEAAATLLTRLPSARDTGASGTLENTALALGRSGWLITLALLLTFVALHGVLIAKYRRAQRINLERRRALNKPVRPVGPLLVMRYYSFTEKLLLVILLAAAFVSVSLGAWYERSAGPVAALSSGTLATLEAQAALSGLPGARGAFLQGYAAQVRGDAEAARASYARAEGYGPALNNLGALENDPARYQEALRVAPEMLEARYNLGETDGGFPFHRDYLPGEPVLAVPAARDVQIARAGSWDGAVASVFVNPWLGFQESRPAQVAPWVWTVLVVLLLLLALVSVLWLFVPRLRWVARAPRPWYYHLLALLVPGSGLADELWGVLLLVPWAVALLDVAAESFGWSLGLGAGLTFFGNVVVLAVVYLVNLAAVVIEYFSYRRRMQSLKRDEPALATEFGLVRPAETR